MKYFIEKTTRLAYGQYFNFLSLLAPTRTIEQAFQTFTKVRKGSVLPHQSAFLDHAKNELLNVCDHHIQTYRWAGNKGRVLLVHGWESNTYRWHDLIEKLRMANFEILAFDAPGHGGSSGTHLPIPLYQKILQIMIDHYRPQQLIGHSVGGLTILYNEYEQPSPSVEKIVTLAAPSEFHEIMAHYRRLLNFNQRVLMGLDTYVQRTFGFQVRELSTSNFVRTNRKKGLIFHDRGDQNTPYHASEQVHANWKGSRLISTEGLGHSMQQDAVNEQLVDFLKS